MVFQAVGKGSDYSACHPWQLVPGGVLFLVPVDTRLPFLLQYASGEGINDDRFDGNILSYAGNQWFLVPPRWHWQHPTEEAGASSVFTWTTAAIVSTCPCGFADASVLWRAAKFCSVNVDAIVPKSITNQVNQVITTKALSLKFSYLISQVRLCWTRKV